MDVKRLPCVHILTGALLTGQVLRTGPDRRQNEAFAEGAAGFYRVYRQDTERETEHLHGIKQPPQGWHGIMTCRHGRMKGFKTERIVLK